MFEFAWNLLSFIVALGILVFIHEWGHFYIARKCGVKVHRFSIGFGRTLFSWRDKQNTEFVIGALPLGGYVKMLDGRVDELNEEDKAFSFDNKSVWKRIAIVAAGPLANFIFAVLALFFMYLLGVSSIRPIVGEVVEDSIVAQAGILPKDKIVAINQTEVKDWESTLYALINEVGEQRLSVAVDREGEVITRELAINNWKISDGDVFKDLGIVPFRPKPTLVLAHIVENSAAFQADLRVNDKLLAINDEAISTWQQASAIFVDSPNIPLLLEVERDGVSIKLSATPDIKTDNLGLSRGFLGVAPLIETWPKDYVFEQRYGIFPALQNALEKTASLIQLSLSTIGKLFTGSVGLESLGGPIAIAQGAGHSAQGGAVYFLSFLALISINLGVVNLLPLPVLDGGHLMYFFIELIKGKPVSQEAQEWGFKLGTVLLISIMAVAIFNDISRF